MYFLYLLAVPGAILQNIANMNAITAAVTAAVLAAVPVAMQPFVDQLTALNSRVTALNGRVTALDGRVTALDGRVTALDGRVTALVDQVTALQDGVNLAFAQKRRDRARTRNQLGDELAAALCPLPNDQNIMPAAGGIAVRPDRQQ